MPITLLRVLIATILLVVVGFTVAPYATSYVSTSAVVNAPLINISAPFSGIIVQPTKPVSAIVETGETLIELKNSRSQRGTLQNAQTRLGSLNGEIVGMEKQMRDLASLRANLIDRRDALVAARTAWFIPRLEEAKANISRANTAFLKAQRNMQRIEQLVKSGSTTQTVALDAETELSAAQADLAQQQAAFNQLQIERDTLDGEMGIDLTANGFEQIEYRLNEIDVRLADINAQLLERQAQRAGLKNQISTLSIEAMRQERFSPKVTTSGIIWEASAREGATVAVGENVAKVLDCSRRFLEVQLPERHFENIPTGTTATVQLKGSTERFTAQVLAAYGSGARPNRDMQAASPRIETNDGFRVIVGLGEADLNDAMAAGSFCDVGRTAEVRFELHQDSLMSRMSRLFEGLGGHDPSSPALTSGEKTAPIATE
ncbi:HlyD family secretion protein [Celeribacter sp.]|uniref:HlyD family secretion protein n=1 Tax=Celeribacter sp. TaxID=1890673 RepID=UPI003A8F9A66